MQKLKLLSLWLLIFGNVFAQQFGGNPPSLKWKQLNTDTARIIFPVGLDSQANRVAAVIHYMAQQKPVSLGDKLNKINIVLQNQTTIANGYVGLGPFRSEFFLTPQLNNFQEGSISWADQIAVHEYRHVQQFNNFNNGLSKTMKVLFGEEGYALAINASIPDWFYEGDAVYNETVLTKQGRGRLPLFLNAFPSIWEANKKYSWMKLRNGSLKDYVPNHYYLGYLLVNYGRDKYGTDFWTKITKDASSFKSLIYPFQSAIKKHSGLDYKKFRNDAFEFYKKDIPIKKSLANSFIFPLKKKYVANYYFPYVAGKDSLIYLKTTYRHRPAFYLKDSLGEHKIKTRDIALDEQYSYRNGKIVYSAFQNDARWGWKDYSVIKMLDIKTGKQTTLTKNSKYFTPDISEDGKMVAVVQVASTGKSELHILKTDDGNVVQRLHSIEINLFTDPKFIDDRMLITAVRLNDGKMALASAEISTGNLKRITTPSYNVIGYPCVHNGLVYFTASFGGNDDVFVWNSIINKIHRLTKGTLGNYFVNVAGNKITWSTFTSEGYQLQQEDLKNINWQEMSENATEELSYKFSLGDNNESSDILLSKVPQRKFPVSKYSKGTGLLNFHSWRPYYEDPIFTFSLYGENVLNTLQTELYYLYNENERTNAVGFSSVYGGFFPYLNIGTELTFNREDVTGNKLRQWNQLDSRIGLSIPLSKTKGQTFRNFNISSFYVHRNEFNKDFFKDSIGNTSFGYLSHSLSWSQQVQKSVQHIYPRLAYSLSSSFRHAISTYKGSQINGTASLNLPGLLSSHNLIMNGSFQQRDTLSQVSFGNRFAYARGYTGRNFSRMWRISGNYHFPLIYPDWGFGNILYLQRIRANAFYDFTKVYSRDKKTTANQRSAGGEVFIDTKWWNQYPLTFGFRVSRLLDKDQYDGFKGTVFEFILPVSILPK
ncbi:MAG: hypothetical protein WBC06_04210 [Chitinophagaceae bacterium]